MPATTPWLAKYRVKGRAMLPTPAANAALLDGLADDRSALNVWMSHGDRVVSLPDGFEAIASTSNAPAAAVRTNGCRSCVALARAPAVSGVSAFAAASTFAAVRRTVQASCPATARADRRS